MKFAFSFSPTGKFYFCFDISSCLFFQISKLFLGSLPSFHTHPSFIFKAYLILSPTLPHSLPVLFRFLFALIFNYYLCIFCALNPSPFPLLLAIFFSVYTLSIILGFPWSCCPVSSTLILLFFFHPLPNTLFQNFNKLSLSLPLLYFFFLSFLCLSVSVSLSLSLFLFHSWSYLYLSVFT